MLIVPCSSLIKYTHMTLAEELRLIDTVNRFFNIDLKEKSRRRELVDMKHAFRYIMRDMGYSFGDIGRMINCHHATVIHSGKKVIDLMEIEPSFKDMVYVMRSVIKDFHLSYRIKTRKLEQNREKSMISTFCVLLNEVKDHIGEDGVEYWLMRAKLEPQQYENIVYTELMLEEA